MSEKINYDPCKKPGEVFCDSYRRNPVHCNGCFYYAPNLSGSKPPDSTPKHGHPMFYEILDELRDLHSRKNHDYAGDDPLSNLKMCERGGLPGWKGVVVRLTDKISRLLAFMKKGEFEVKDESVEDTLKDVAVYAILGLVLYRESKNDTRTYS